MCVLLWTIIGTVGTCKTYLIPLLLVSHSKENDISMPFCINGMLCVHNVTLLQHFSTCSVRVFSFFVRMGFVMIGFLQQDHLILAMQKSLSKQASILFAPKKTNSQYNISMLNIVQAARRPKGPSIWLPSISNIASYNNFVRNKKKQNKANQN